MLANKMDYGILIFVVVVTLCMLVAVGYQLEDSAEHSAKMAARQVEADSEFREREKLISELEYGTALVNGATLGIVYKHCTGKFPTRDWLVTASRNPKFRDGTQPFSCHGLSEFGTEAGETEEQ